MKIGFIGQGYIGSAYADVVEAKGYNVVRYSLEEEYKNNKSLIKECDIVFIAVPTPTTSAGHDYSLVEEVLDLVGDGMTAVIKSTLLPGTTKKLQGKFSNITILHSPEFLSRDTAKKDVEQPRRSIVGVADSSEDSKKKANQVLSLLPKAPYELVTTSDESEMIKYVNNTFFYVKTVFMNILYDVAMAHGCSWDNIKEAMEHEPWIGNNHLEPVHRSGRGAGGPCLIKDFSAFTQHFSTIIDDELDSSMLHAIEKKNISLLQNSMKDMEEMLHVYGNLKDV